MQKLFELHEHMNLHTPMYRTGINLGGWLAGELMLCACGKALNHPSETTTTTLDWCSEAKISDRSIRVTKAEASAILKCAPKEVIESFLSHYKLDAV